MSTELTKPNGNDDANETKHTMLLLGGAALLVFGVGLVLSNPAVRRRMGNGGIGSLFLGVIPDLERYMKIRSM